jgi:hypothetical protein
LCLGVPLGKVVEVRFLDTNPFDDISNVIHYCHQYVPLMDLDSEVYVSFT